MKINKSIVTKFVSKGETKKAIEYLLKVIEEDSNLYSSIINLSARYNRLSQDKLKGIIDDNDFNIEINKINLSLVDFGEEQMDVPNIEKQKGFSKYIIGLLFLGLLATGFWFGYSNFKESNIESLTKTNEDSNNEQPINLDSLKPEKKKAPEIIIPTMPLTTEYTLNSFTGANFTVANKTDNIVLIRNIKVLWDYNECTSFKQLTSGSVMMTYNYDVKITKEKSEKIVDRREFTYSKGEIEKFNINIIYPGKGVYNIWIGFEYKTFGSGGWHDYISHEKGIEICYQ